MRKNLPSMMSFGTCFLDESPVMPSAGTLSRPISAVESISHAVESAHVVIPTDC